MDFVHKDKIKKPKTPKVIKDRWKDSRPKLRGSIFKRNLNVPRGK